MPTCPRCGDVVLVWHDGWGYRCPGCYLFVAIPKKAVPTSTACRDCLDGKHQACTGAGWNHSAEEPAPCDCEHHAKAEAR